MDVNVELEILRMSHEMNMRQVLSAILDGWVLKATGVNPKMSGWHFCKGIDYVQYIFYHNQTRKQGIVISQMGVSAKHSTIKAVNALRIHLI